MIYKLPVAAGLSVSDANQKSLNLNALQALPMTECTGAEYNGVISGWSVKAESPDDSLTNAVFVDGDELRFKGNGSTYTPTINGEELDGSVQSSGASWTLMERQFLDAEIIDVSDRVFLRRNIGGDALIFDSRADESKETIDCPRPYIFARLAIGRDVADDIAVSIDAQEIRIYKSTTGTPVATIAVDGNITRAFADAFCAYKADVYAYKFGGELIFDFVGRGESAESVFYFTLYAGNNLRYPITTSGTIASVLWAFFDVADKTGYFLAALSNGNFVLLKKAGKTVERLGNIISSPGEIASSAGCWSEFEWYYKGADESGLPAIKRNYITSTGAQSDTPAILGTSELIGATGTRAGYIVHTLNGIPATIEKDGFYIGGFSGEISTAFPDTSDVYLYHSSGRLIEFVPRKNDFDALIDGSSTARVNAVAISKVKKKMVRFATRELPAVFDFDSKKFIYTNVAYTGAVEAVISGSPAEDKYKQTAFAALMINEIANTVCTAKILPMHDDIVTGKVKITVRSPKFYGDEYGITDPIFSFFCGQDIADKDDESSAMRTVNIDYLYNFAAGTIGYDYTKEGTQFAEGIYNTLLPLPIWAKIREDNPRVADGGNITFFCATNPSAQYRGMGDIGYSNYYVGSSFDSLDSYMFLSGKNFLFKDESISELLLAANGSISSVSRYIENIKFDYIGQNQSEAFFLSRADKAFYRYTGYFQLVRSFVFSNLPELRKGQYVSTIDSLFFYPEGDFKNIYVLRDSKVALAQLFGDDETGGVIAVQESDEHSVKVYTIGADKIPYYTDISLRKEAGYHQQAFRLVSNYVGLPYTELQVKSIALTFYVTMSKDSWAVNINFEYRWRYAESAGSESAEYTIRLDDTEVDPSGRRFVRLRFIPQTQKVVDFAVGLSVPELREDVSVLSVEFAGIDIEVEQKEKPLIGERWSR